MEPLVLFVTTPGDDESARIARVLVEERLAACCNLMGNIRSVYRWEGAVEEENESLMIIKSTAEHLEALTARIVELHPYDVPEVIALPIAGGSAPYLEWVRANTGREGEG